MNRNAKIVATIGPSCSDKKTLKRLIQAGMDVARLNFSHGSQEEHAARISLIRELSIECNKPISILQDLQGPKLRVGKLPGSGIRLIPGEPVKLSSSLDNSQKNGNLHIPLDVPGFENSVQVGSRILLDDGNLELVVTSIEEFTVHAEVVIGGSLHSHKGVNLPGAQLGIASLTKKDIRDLSFGLGQGIDAIAISFVCNKDDILAVREAVYNINQKHDGIPIIAKLERPEAVENLEEIVAYADGVMVARGDLAVETSAAEVPIMQKKIIEMANQHAKLVVTATQMLDSMIHNPRPTRAEASDVANAIFDGSDAVMLSGETAIGKYPVKSITMMNDIIIKAEENYPLWGYDGSKVEMPTHDDSLSLTRAARELAQDRNVASIAVFTRSGRTALLMSKVRSKVPIFAFTPDHHTFQRLGLYWGVVPFLVPYASTIESMLEDVETAIMAHTDAKPGQQTVIISGYPVGAFRPANLILLHTLGMSVPHTITR
jgi:pyruvate kinase